MDSPVHHSMVPFTSHEKIKQEQNICGEKLCDLPLLCMHSYCIEGIEKILKVTFTSLDHDASMSVLITFTKFNYTEWLTH